MENNILVTGAGGFIGGHLVKRLSLNDCSVTGVDIKNISDWYQVHNNVNNYQLNLQNMMIVCKHLMKPQ